MYSGKLFLVRQHLIVKGYAPLFSKSEYASEIHQTHTSEIDLGNSSFTSQRLIVFRGALRRTHTLYTFYKYTLHFGISPQTRRRNERIYLVVPLAHSRFAGKENLHRHLLPYAIHVNSITSKPVQDFGCPTSTRRGRMFMTCQYKFGCFDFHTLAQKRRVSSVKALR